MTSAKVQYLSGAITDSRRPMLVRVPGFGGPAYRTIPVRDIVRIAK